MKRSHKIYLFTSTLASTLLAATFAFAAPETTKSHSDSLLFQDYQYFLPQIQSDGRSIIKVAQNIRYQHDNALLPVSSSKKPLHRSCGSKKKNELYELSAIFNDKLQLFLSYFNDRPVHTASAKSKNDEQLIGNQNISF